MEIELNEEWKKIDLVAVKYYHVSGPGKIKFVTKDGKDLCFLDKDKDKKVMHQMALKEFTFPFIHKLMLTTSWFNYSVAIAVNRAKFEK